MESGNSLAAFAVVQTECFVLGRRDHLVSSVVKADTRDVSCNRSLRSAGLIPGRRGRLLLDGILEDFGRLQPPL